MENSRTYIDIMIQSLERKKAYLEEILKYTENQEMLIKEKPFNQDEFDKIIDKKDILIKNINEIDKGFSSVYDRIKIDLASKKLVYHNSLVRIQNLIKDCVDLGVKIEATEDRNRQEMEVIFANGFRDVKRMKKSRSAANKYYKSMSNGYINDSLLYDTKK